MLSLIDLLARSVLFSYFVSSYLGAKDGPRPPISSKSSSLYVFTHEAERTERT